jgi:plasmid maintenance system antidote protein VapI
LGKKVSEVNELIKGKRNITIQRDILLETVFDDEPRKWIMLQMEYDYATGNHSVDAQKLTDIRYRKNLLQESKPRQEEKVLEK